MAKWQFHIKNKYVLDEAAKSMFILQNRNIWDGLEV
jgi:hypothetical protein